MGARTANCVMPVIASVVFHALMGGLAHARSDRGTPPPNILLVVADDIGTDMVGAYGLGSHLPPTPNIDQLAAEGLLFREAWDSGPRSRRRFAGAFGFRNERRKQLASIWFRDMEIDGGQKVFV